METQGHIRFDAWRTVFLLTALAGPAASCGDGAGARGDTGAGAGNGPPLVSMEAVRTSSGTFRGTASRRGLGTEFRGIRYATAPRWQPPQSVTAAPDVTVADTFGAVCPAVGAPAESEDCLFVNIYVPPGARIDDKLPVLMFIHGGGFVTGSGQLYTPTSIVAENQIIAVTINYRLGALGWLSSSKLAASAANDFEAPGDAGNYGLMDQQFALRWVRDNIAGFGGDPAKVTVSGESAGGISVVATLTSVDTAQNLFRGAIIESGAFFYASSQSAASRQARFGRAFEADLGCDSAACMRSKTVAQVLASQNRIYGRYNLGPVHGTKLVPETPRAAFEAGRFLRIPVMQGVTANEGRFFVMSLLAPLPPRADMLAEGGPANYDVRQPNAYCGTAGAPATCTYAQLIEKVLTHSTPDATDAVYLRIIEPPAITSGFVSSVAAAYLPENFKNPFQNNAPSADMAIAQFWGDAVVSCPSRAADAALSRFVKVYAFELDDAAAPQAADTAGFPLGSQHTAELNYLFDQGASLNSDQKKLAQSMRRYWGNFVKDLEPKDPSLPAFDAFPAAQVFSPEAGQLRSVADFDQRHFCSSLWDAVQM